MEEGRKDGEKRGGPHGRENIGIEEIIENSNKSKKIEMEEVEEEVVGG